MLEDFLSRMGQLSQEMDRLANQAEEMERVVRDQQTRLEEMDLLVRQRDEQLAEQQARVEELEETLRQREEELEQLRTQLSEREGTLAQQDEELEDLRTQLAQREASEVALREELAETEARLAELEEAREGVSVEPLLGRFSALEDRVYQQGEVLSQLHSLVEEEMAELFERLDRLEAGLVMALLPTPAEVVAPPVVEEEVPVVEAAPVTVEIPIPPREPPAAVEVIAPPVEIEVAVEDPLQVLLYEALENLPEAKLIGLVGRDGLSVEMMGRGETASELPLEVELAELTADAHRVATALGTGPLLTLAFQAGEEQYLVSPVNEDYFAFLLTPAGSVDEFRRAQAILLQAVSRLSELC